MKRLMKNSMLALAGASLFLVGSEAKAITTNSVTTDTYGPATADWNHNFVLQQFNPALGSLQSVYIQVTESIEVSGTVANTGATSASFTFTPGSVLTVTMPGALGELIPNPNGIARFYTLPAGGSAPYVRSLGSDTVDTEFVLPADMEWFKGTGTFLMPSFTQVQNSFAGGGGKIVPSLVTMASGTIQVQYTYIASIPEPAALSLLAMGGAMWLLRKRR